MQILLAGELAEQAVGEIPAGGEASPYMPFSRLVVGDRRRVEETRWPHDRPVKPAVHHQGFHSSHVCVHRPPNSQGYEWFQDPLEEEPSAGVHKTNGGVGGAGADADEAANAGGLHCLHDVSNTLRINSDRLSTVRDPEGGKDGV